MQWQVGDILREKKTGQYYIVQEIIYQQEYQGHVAIVFPVDKTGKWDSALRIIKCPASTFEPVDRDDPVGKAARKTWLRYMLMP